MFLAKKIRELPFWQGLFIFSILLVFIKIILSHPINLDVSSFIHMARLVLFHDKVLYKDIIDINPPLCTWLFMPPLWVAGKLNADSTTAIYACLGFAAIILLHVVTLTNSILKNEALRLSPLRRAIAVTGLVMMIFWANVLSFPQRELLIAIFLLPYLLLTCLNLSGSLPSSSHAIRFTCGLYAILGLALKPHYALALIIPELFVFFKKNPNRASKNKSRAVFDFFGRLENATIFILGLLYTTFIILFYPDLFTTSLPTALTYYHALSLVDLRSELITFGILLAIVGTRLLFSLFRSPQNFDPLLLGGFGAYLGYASQKMGFAYQVIPVEILLGFWMILAFPACRTKEKEIDITDACWNFLNKKNIRPSLFLVLFLAVSFLSFELSQRYGLSRFAGGVMHALEISETHQAENHRHTTALLQKYADKKPVLFLSTGLGAFPSVVYEDLDITSRWFSLWPLPAELDMPPEKQGYVARALAEDMARTRPHLVLVLKFPILHALPLNFDILGYLQKWPEFKKEWEKYTPIPPDPTDTRGPYILYRRVE